MVAALVAAVSLVAAPCAATPIHREPLPRGGSLATIPWVAASPTSSGIVGVFFGYDPSLQRGRSRPRFAVWAHGRHGNRNMKVLWIARGAHATASTLSVHAQRQDGPGRTVVSLTPVADASPHPAAGAEYSSIVALPSAGCWRLDVRSGADRGSLVVRVVSP